jgi:hypothetical protein
MGMLPQMYAVCRAFDHYGRVDPNNEWLQEFQCYDGLMIEQVDENAQRVQHPEANAACGRL